MEKKQRSRESQRMRFLTPRVRFFIFYEAGVTVPAAAALPADEALLHASSDSSAAITHAARFPKAVAVSKSVGFIGMLGCACDPFVCPSHW